MKPRIFATNLLIFLAFLIPVSLRAPAVTRDNPTPLLPTASLTEIKPIKAKFKEIQPLAVAPSSPAPKPAAVGVVANCGDNQWAHDIYMNESGCRLINPNGSGCDGIGQACPASKLSSVCPNMDYACQNAWFTNYAKVRYGGWQQAYNAWYSQYDMQGHHWW